MVVQCPQCGAGLLMDEEEFQGRSHLRVQCAKCQSPYVVKAPRDGSPSGKEGPPEPGPQGITTVIGGRMGLPEGKRAALLVMQGPLKGEIFRLTKPEVIIGRKGTDIVVNDPEVSGTHCALEVRDNYAVLTDLDSTNGTFVGEEQIKSHRLEHLSEFRIGTTILMFTITDAEQ